MIFQSILAEPYESRRRKNSESFFVSDIVFFWFWFNFPFHIFEILKLKVSSSFRQMNSVFSILFLKFVCQ